MVSQRYVLVEESRTSIRLIMSRMLPTAAFAPGAGTLSRAFSASFKADMMVFFTNCDGRVDWGGWEGGGVAWCWIGDKELLDCDELMVSDG